MLLCGHLNIVLRNAERSVHGKESTVTTIQDIHFGVCEFGVLVDIDCAIFVSNKLGPKSICKKDISQKM